MSISIFNTCFFRCRIDTILVDDKLDSSCQVLNSKALLRLSYLHEQSILPCYLYPFCNIDGEIKLIDPLLSHFFDTFFILLLLLFSNILSEFLLHLVDKILHLVSVSGVVCDLLQLRHLRQIF